MNTQKLNRTQLTHVLRSIAAAVEEGDSFEGSLTYSISGPDEFEVQAAWRVGNSQGQGGMNMIGAPAEAPKLPPETEPEGCERKAVCMLCSKEEASGFYMGCLIKDGHCKDSGWNCDGQGNLTRTTPAEHVKLPVSAKGRSFGGKIWFIEDAGGKPIAQMMPPEDEASCRELVQFINQALKT